MWQHNKRAGLLFMSSLLLLQSSIPLSTSTDICPNQAALGGADTMLVALLSLHRGTSCEEVRLKPLQQMAAAQLALKAINHVEHGDGLTVGLQVMDTCSESKQAVRMAFKALVFSDTTICKKSPLFLGFLGPDNGELLDAVQKITSVFRLSHVTPLSFSTYQAEIPNPYHVASFSSADKIKGILQLLKHIHWTAVSVLYSSDTYSTLLATSLISASLNSGPCVTLQRALPTEGSDYPEIMSEISTVGVLVIAPPEQLLDLLSYPSFSKESRSYIFVASEAGVLPGLSLTDNLSTSVLVMQQVSSELPGLEQQISKSSVWDEYLYQQRCNHSSCTNTDPSVAELALIQDPSVVPISHAIRLYSRSLRIAHKLKCSGKAGLCPALTNMNPEEWKGILGSATDKGVRFQMEQRSFFKLFFKSPFSHGIKKVGSLSDGGRQFSLDDIQLPESHYALCKNDSTSEDNTFPSLPAVETLTTKAPVSITRGSNVFKDNQRKESTITDKSDDNNPFKTFFNNPDMDIFDLSTYGTPELIGALVALGCCIALVFSLLIYVVYASFRVKGEEASRGGSSRRSSVRSA